MQKNTDKLSCPYFLLIQFREGLFLVLLHFGEALAAVNRTVLSGLEGNLSFGSAGSAGSGEHFLLRSGFVFTGIAALFASLGLVYEASFSVEFLLAGCENKFGSAFLANQGFVCVHRFYLT